jgi:hypothetical protein
MSQKQTIIDLHKEHELWFKERYPATWRDSQDKNVAVESASYQASVIISHSFVAYMQGRASVKALV